MPTAVKVDEDAKAYLEELQAEIRLRTGERVTQQALLSWLIEDAIASKEEVIDAFRRESVPLTDDEIEVMLSYRFASGSSIDEADIDELLYG
ncbi:MAG: hypothetical protein ACOC42_03745 [Halobacteriota archaeon]